MVKLVSCEFHNLKFVGSSPTPATDFFFFIFPIPTEIRSVVKCGVFFLTICENMTNIILQSKTKD